MRLRWPVIAKPNHGSASVGIICPRSPGELLALDADLIVQELLRGLEYTVNMFFDQSGRLRCAVPHQRIEVRSGEVSKGRTERLPQLMAAARTIADILPDGRGPICFQAIIPDEGGYSVFEINARFGGGYPLAHRAGARFSQWLLEEITGLPSSAGDSWCEGVIMLRYDEAIFLNA